MRTLRSVTCLGLLLAAGCGPRHHHTLSLSQARAGFATKLIHLVKANEPADVPPNEVLRLVHYPSSVGNLAAYLSPVPRDGKRHPAIIWIFGGFDNGIGDTAWVPASPENDQSARAFREAGIITMYPSLRGGNDNPGFNERFYGEVNDVVAAADFLARQQGVDPKRIYLGGHSTGGTLALLVAEYTGRFRATFAFGPVSDVRRYGADGIPFDAGDRQEVEARSPIEWLASIRTPTFLFEGAERISNIGEVKRLCATSENPRLQGFEVANADHFSTLAAVTPVVAQKIVDDTGPTCRIAFTEPGLTALGTH